MGAYYYDGRNVMNVDSELRQALRDRASDDSLLLAALERDPDAPRWALDYMRRLVLIPPVPKINRPELPAYRTSPPGAINSLSRPAAVPGLPFSTHKSA